MYSQNSEEQFIESYFTGQTGRFLDIGAFDGKTFSNTLRLAELGWHGVEVEPEPNVFLSLLSNLKNFPNVKLVHAAFAKSARGLVKFYGSRGDAISTTSEAHKVKWEAGWTVDYQEMYVPLVTIRDIIDTFGAKFEFVNLDVESTNLELLHELPLGEMETKCICIEHDGHQDVMREYCAKFGLTKQILENGENIILVKP
jgi:FkbM family methyltransferase